MTPEDINAHCKGELRATAVHDGPNEVWVLFEKHGQEIRLVYSTDDVPSEEHIAFAIDYQSDWWPAHFAQMLAEVRASA